MDRGKKRILLIISLICLVAIGYAIYSIGFKQGQDSFKENGLITQEGNITYHKYFDSYYNIYYSNNEEGVTFQINNSCIIFQRLNGISMLPYYKNETIILVDTCFPLSQLEIGDVISFYVDLNQSKIFHHRIVGINYKKELIETKGDNLNQTDTPVSFNQVIGKEIGVLNILDETKVVKEVYNQTNETTVSLTCVCSSNSILKVCGPNKEQLITDNFVTTNNLKEENCNG